MPETVQGGFYRLEQVEHEALPALALRGCRHGEPNPGPGFYEISQRLTIDRPTRGSRFS